MKKKEFPLYIDMEQEEIEYGVLCIHGFYLYAKSDERLRFSGKVWFFNREEDIHSYYAHIEIDCQELGTYFNLAIKDRYELPLCSEITKMINGKSKKDKVDWREYVAKILIPYIECTFKKAKQALKGKI